MESAEPGGPRRRRLSEVARGGPGLVGVTPAIRSESAIRLEDTDGDASAPLESSGGTPDLILIYATKYLNKYLNKYLSRYLRNS